MASIPPASSSNPTGPAHDAASLDQRSGIETATLGGGCFWCLEAVYLDVNGVVAVESGYAGGQVEAPNYEQICEGNTGHAEVVRVSFDPSRIGYRDILHIFFAIHDPTTLNRQGHDVGTQYRSVIFTHSEAQRDAVREIIDDLERQRVYDDPVVTQVLPAPRYWPAEAYHQNYFARNPFQGYCMMVVGPKVAKFRSHYAHFLKKVPR